MSFYQAKNSNENKISHKFFENLKQKRYLEGFKERLIYETCHRERIKLEIAGPQDAHVDGTVTVFNEQATGEKGVTHFFYNYYYYPLQNDDDNGEDDGEGLTEDDFSWEWYDFDTEEEENDDTVDDWGIDSNILPEN